MILNVIFFSVKKNKKNPGKRKQFSGKSTTHITFYSGTQASTFLPWKLSKRNTLHSIALLYFSFREEGADRILRYNTVFRKDSTVLLSDTAQWEIQNLSRLTPLFLRKIKLDLTVLQLQPCGELFPAFTDEAFDQVGRTAFKQLFRC